MKKVSLAVSDFALPAPRKGSIDAFSGFGRALEVGLEIHQRIQAERTKEFSNYRAEVWTQHDFEAGGYKFEVLGRMDGIFDREKPKIEEIKSSFSIYELARRMREAESESEHPYCLQVKTYAYFHYLKTGVIPDITLLLVSSRDGETIDFDLRLDIAEYEGWLARRLQELVEEAIRAEKRVRRRQKAAKAFEFPFEQPRHGQIELIATIEESMKENHPMLIQAPTGLGKTVGVLYPTLREALSRGQRVVYITPKNSQHSVAEDAVDRLQEKGANIKSMTLTAKSKMCMKAEPLCNPEYCEYAKDHYTKVAANHIPEILAKKRSLSAKTFKKLGEEFQVCPFEIQLETVNDVDAVICDYNYVFAPRSVLGRTGGCNIDSQGKPNLVIDEAHNLPARAMDYYSPSLSVFALEKMREDINRLPLKFRGEAAGLLDRCIGVVKACAPDGCDKACKIDPPAAMFLEQDADLRQFLSTYLKADIVIEPRDVVLRLCFYWAGFTEALEFVGEDRKEFFTTFHPHPATVKITCCDASEMLAPCYDQYDQVVAFSATLKPFEFYSQLAGLQSKKLVTAEFVSPFPKDHRKLLIIPQISSKYSERQRNYPRIAEAIQKITALRSGNYFAFFPSFDFMERVLAEFHAPEGFAVLKQERSMSRNDIADLIDGLAVPGSAQIVFAVQGGVFSEGIDYPGDMVIGAFVVGPPLPIFDLEREKMREYYEEHYKSGFDYAYVYPAMAKAVQAAGRVIRSEKDQGIIVLMDNRFIQPSFAKAMPQDWFNQDPRELVSDRILGEISEFWAEAERSRHRTGAKELP